MPFFDARILKDKAKALEELSRRAGGVPEVAKATLKDMGFTNEEIKKADAAGKRRLPRQKED